MVLFYWFSYSPFCGVGYSVWRSRVLRLAEYGKGVDRAFVGSRFPVPAFPDYQSVAFEDSEVGVEGGLPDSRFFAEGLLGRPAYAFGVLVGPEPCHDGLLYGMPSRKHFGGEDAEGSFFEVHGLAGYGFVSFRFRGESVRPGVFFRVGFEEFEFFPEVREFPQYFLHLVKPFFVFGAVYHELPFRDVAHLLFDFFVDSHFAWLVKF